MAVEGKKWSIAFVISLVLLSPLLFQFIQEENLPEAMKRGRHVRGLRARYSNILFDDEHAEAFWIPKGEQTISTDRLIKAVGASSCKIVPIGEPGQYQIDVYHNWETNQDFSEGDTISLWFYGTNNGLLIYVQFYEVVWIYADHGFTLTFTDDTEGWKRVFLLKADAEIYGDISWSLIRSMEVISQGKETVAWIDCLAIGYTVSAE